MRSPFSDLLERVARRKWEYTTVGAKERDAPRGGPFALISVLISNPLIKGTDFLEPSPSLHQAAKKKKEKKRCLADSAVI